MKRRSFLGAMLAAACAPAIVSARSLMPVRQLAPSSTDAIVERALIDRMAMFGDSAGVVELFSMDDILLGTIKVAPSGPAVGGEMVFAGTGAVDVCGQFKRAQLRMNGLVLPVEAAGLGTHLTPGMDIVCNYLPVRIYSE